MDASARRDKKLNQGSLNSPASLVRFDHVAKHHRKRESPRHVNGCKT
jgi:hypothetical protein